MIKVQQLSRVSEFLSRSRVLSFLWAVSLLGILGGQVLDGVSGAILISGIGWKISLAIAFFWTCFGIAKAGLSKSSRSNTLGILSRVFGDYRSFFLIFVLYFLSDLPQRRFSFYADRSLVVDLLLLGVFSFVIFRFVFSACRVRGIFCVRNLFLLQVVLLVFYVSFAYGKMIYTDDHPSFLYRLHLLKEHFPHLPFYNTDWNAGYNSREFFPSGMLNVFFLLSPFLYTFARFDNLGDASWYSFLPFMIIVFLAPWLTYAATRLFRFSQESALCAALLALYPSTMTFEWSFKYGTLGFMTSTAFVSLCLALSYRLAFGRLALEKRFSEWWYVGALVPISFFTVSWSLSSFILVPFVFLALFNFRTVFAVERRLKVLFFIGAFLAINLPWIFIFVNESRVLSFVSLSSLPGAHERGSKDVKDPSAGNLQSLPSDAQGRDIPIMFDTAKESPSFAASSLKGLDHAVSKLRANLLKVNPLLLLLVVPALAILPDRRVAFLFSITLSWLFALVLLGEEFKPQLELKRMVLVASYLMCIPVGHLVVSTLRGASFKLMDTANKGVGVGRWVPSVVLSILLLGNLGFVPIKLAESMAMRTEDKYRFADPTVEQLAEAIKVHSGSGRTFFSGFILHELNSSSYDAQDGGHVAPLAMLTGRELYASDFYHAKWSATDPIPRSYLVRGEQGVEEFLDLINATLVVTHLKEWRNYFRKTSGYVEVAQAGRFRLFKRERSTGSFFLKGEGQVERTKNGLRVKMQSPEVVIKYRYQPRLKVHSSSDVELFPVPVFTEDTGGGNTAEVFYIGLRARTPGDLLQPRDLLQPSVEVSY